MKRVEILVEESLYEFYRKVGAQAGGLPAERVMADALLKLAGELSLQALDKKRRPGERKKPWKHSFHGFLNVNFTRRGKQKPAYDPCPAARSGLYR